MKYIKRIDELNQETYIEASRKAYNNRHYSKSSNLFRYAYPHLIKPIEMRFYDGKSIIIEQFILSNVILGSGRSTIKSFHIIFTNDRHEKVINVDLNDETFTLKNRNLFGSTTRPLVDRRGAVLLKQILLGPAHDCIRDMLHDFDGDIEILENFDKSINDLILDNLYEKGY